MRLVGLVKDQVPRVKASAVIATQKRRVGEEELAMTEKA